MRLKTLSIILVIYVSVFSGLCFAKSPMADIPGLTDKIYKNFCGTWYCFDPNHLYDPEIYSFGWGKGTIVQDILVIDFTDKITPDIAKWYKPPAIVFMGDNPFRIISIASLSKKTLKINAEDIFGKEVIFILNLDDDGSFWFESTDQITSGKDYIYKRISKPK